MKVLCITGENGVGKSHLANLLNKGAGFNMIKSYTTRDKRGVDEEDHIFVDEKDIGDVYSKYDVVASSDINGGLYWATREQFKDDVVNVYVVDSEGYEDLLQHNWDVRLVFVRADVPARENTTHIPVGLFDYVDYYFDNSDHEQTFRQVANLIRKMNDEWSWEV